jgi:hypothetical protein
VSSKPATFNFQPPTFNFQLSTFNLQPPCGLWTVDRGLWTVACGPWTSQLVLVLVVVLVIVIEDEDENDDEDDNRNEDKVREVILEVRCKGSWARSVWSARSLLPLSGRPRLAKAPASWTHSKRFALQEPPPSPTSPYLRPQTLRVAACRRGRCGCMVTRSRVQLGAPVTVSGCTLEKRRAAFVVASEMRYIRVALADVMSRWSPLQLRCKCGASPVPHPPWRPPPGPVWRPRRYFHAC